MNASTVTEFEGAPSYRDLRDAAAEANECAALLLCLSRQREHVLGALEGLPEQALRQHVLPSGWTCAGLVQHLALDVERFWFRQVMTGEQVEADQFGDDGWRVRPEVPTAAVLDLYRREIDLADKIITGASLEAAPAWWPDFFSPGFHLDELRQVLLHVIAETATHAGHLDAARELIDGGQWMVLA
jgi:uncharacterized damage-inducible protein DinB